MSTITKELAKLFRKITNSEIDAEGNAHVVLSPADSLLINNARIALASLEAEAVAYIIQDAQARGLGRPGFLSFDASISDEDINEYEISVTPLYTAPQLPQPAMPDIATVETTYPDVQTNWQDAKMYAEGWNACRAAMLQGSEPVQGWIPCSDRMPTKNDRVLIFINFNSDTVPPSIHDAQFTGSTFRRGNATVNVFPLEDGYGVTHWMPLPAAPQQEVTQALAKGMERYGDAMQKLADSGD